MGYTNTTPQFGLPQYAPADMPQREDFNKAFKTISENMGKGGDVQSVNGKTGVVNLNANDVGAVSKAGDTMTGALSIRKVDGNGHAIFTKSHAASADYGTAIEDYDKDGKSAILKIQAYDQTIAAIFNGAAQNILHTGNIGSQSVNYANSAGSARLASDPGNISEATIKPIYAGTGDMTAGSTGLTTGVIYIVYE